MPRPGPVRRNVPLKLSAAEESPVQAVAEAEHNGNLSAAIRALLVEALEHRGGSVQPVGVSPEPPPVAVEPSPVPERKHPAPAATQFAPGSREALRAMRDAKFGRP